MVYICISVMKNKMERRKIFVLGIAIAVIVCVSVAAFYFASAPPYETPTEPATRTVTDMAGRAVQIPAEVNRVATFVGPSYEKTFLLGADDKISMVSSFHKRPWAQKLNPNLKNISIMQSYKDPNTETLLQSNIDIVFYWDWPKPVEKMTTNGIPVICSLSGKRPESIEEFNHRFQDDVRLYGDVLGPVAKERAEDYCAYFDEKVGKITSVTSTIPENERPKVYYIRGPEVLTTHGRYSNTHWYVEMAGGNLVSKDLSQTVADVPIEQVLAWNPDIIVMGRLSSINPIMNDSRWININAVKEDKVYVNPEGVFFWDYGCEGPLFLMFLAKTFHPDKFTDLNMTKEVKYFYSKFYCYDLTDDEVKRILHHLPPAEMGEGVIPPRP